MLHEWTLPSRNSLHRRILRICWQDYWDFFWRLLQTLSARYIFGTSEPFQIGVSRQRRQALLAANPRTPSSGSGATQQIGERLADVLKGRTVVIHPEVRAHIPRGSPELRTHHGR